MLHPIVDTSTWLDLAGHRDGERWIVAIRLLAMQERLELLIREVGERDPGGSACSSSS
jgi:hypothetical protein